MAVAQDAWRRRRGSVAPLQQTVEQRSRIVEKRAPALVEKVDKQQEASPPLERMMGGLPLASEVPLALKPTFNGGPGAALSVKF